MALESHRLEWEDEAYKSYGVLKYARRLSRKDAMIFLSQLMTGIADGLLNTEGTLFDLQADVGNSDSKFTETVQPPLRSGRTGYCQGGVS